MKKITKIIGSVLIACGVLFSACSDMLDTDTDRYVLTEDNDLGSANDTLYTMLGILNQMRALGDRYIVLGELRADLMDVTETSTSDLLEINNIDYSNSENPYYSSKEYFSVINNCNYYISKVDTSIMIGGKDVMLMEYAAIKAIRAWTYMQLVLNYGKAPYIETPILTLEDMNREYPVVDIYGLADRLIKDLTPYEYLQYPDYTITSRINGYEVSNLLIPISYLLGDLYLWKGDYVNAATHYHKLFSGEVTPDPTMSYSLSMYSANWDQNPAITENASANCAYSNMFSNLTGQVYSVISDVAGLNATTMNIQFLTNYSLAISNSRATYELAPSEVAMNNWTSSRNAYWNDNDRSLYYLQGDLRGNLSRIYTNACGSNSYSYYYTLAGDTIPVITKYGDNNCAFLYRNATLWLRYAEAVNRAGKPTVAMMVLKRGLSEQILQDYVDPEELGTGARPAYLDFSYQLPNSSVMGVHRRGSGSAEQDTLYDIPATLETTLEKMDYVEKLIIEELALETAFEGNRFHDLMRFAKRRGNEVGEGVNILSKLVRQKNPAAGDKLQDEKNWYIPYKFIEEQTEPENPEIPEEE